MKLNMVAKNINYVDPSQMNLPYEFHNLSPLFFYMGHIVFKQSCLCTDINSACKLTCNFICQRERFYCLQGVLCLLNLPNGD